MTVMAGSGVEFMLRTSNCSLGLHGDESKGIHGRPCV